MRKKRKNKMRVIRDIFPDTNLLEGATIERQEDGMFVITGPTIIKAGVSANGNNYSEDVLKAAVPKYEGVNIVTDHPSVFRPHSVKDVVGKVENPYWDAKSKAIKAGRVIFSSTAEDILTKAKEGLIGDLSHNARGETEQNRRGGKIVRDVKAIAEVFSVDLVTRAAAGGSLHEELQELHERHRQNKLACERMSDNMSLLDDINLKELANTRPDLLEEHKKEVLSEIEASTDTLKTKQDDPVALTVEDVQKTIADGLAEHQKSLDEKATVKQREVDVDGAVGVALSESAATDKVKALIKPGLRSFVSELKEIDAKPISEHLDKMLNEMKEAVAELDSSDDTPPGKKTGKGEKPLFAHGFSSAVN